MHKTSRLTLVQDALVPVREGKVHSVYVHVHVGARDLQNVDVGLILNVGGQVAAMANELNTGAFVGERSMRAPLYHHVGPYLELIPK